MMLELISKKARPISLVIGFLVAVIGAGWSYTFIDRFSEETQQLSDKKASLRKQIETLSTIASQYFITNQQGDLIFALSLQADARQDLVALLYRGNLLDRATPVRNMIGALALAKMLDYRSTYDAYEKQNQEARLSFTFENFTNLKLTEKNIIVQGEERVPVLLDELGKTEQTVNAVEAKEKRSRLTGQLISMFGALILLCVNLFGSKERKI